MDLRISRSSSGGIGFIDCRSADKLNFSWTERKGSFYLLKSRRSLTLAFSSPRKINRVEDITFRYPSFILPRIEQLQLQLLPFWPAFFRPSFLDRNLVFSHPSPLLSLRFSRPRAPPQSSSPEATAVVTTAIWWVFPLKGHTWLLFALAFSNHPGQILLFVV